MSAEVDYPPSISHLLPDTFDYPGIHDDTVPFVYDVEVRPQKRVRLATTALSQLDTNVALQPWIDIESATSLHGRYLSPSPPASLPPTGSKPKQRSSSVPPRSKPGRKKKYEPVPEDGPFIQESFAFPEQQTWLKPRPRQRKAIVDAAKDVPVHATEVPDQGDALSLDKHADQIAALIVQKRKENDSKLFRERMSVQQRLHRGEEDSNDKMIAASHEELKRKMELSAKGIFEETVPEGKQHNLTHTETTTAFIPAGKASSNTTPAPDESAPGASSESSLPELEMDLSNDEQSNPVSQESAVNEQVILPDSIESPEPQQHIPATGDAAAVYAPYMSAAASYYQSQIQTTVTTQTTEVSTQAAYPQATQFFFSQPRFANQRFNNPHIMWQGQQQSSTQPQQQQQWTAQMWQSLPSTSTPIMQPSALVQSTHTPHPEASMLRHSQTQASAPQPDLDSSIRMNQQTSLDFFGPAADSHPTSGEIESANTLTASHSVKPLQSSNLAPSNLETRQLPILRSNVNMFTRQARENGVIGGNNNYSESPTGEKRRNMFTSRP